MGRNSEAPGFAYIPPTLTTDAASLDVPWLFSNGEAIEGKRDCDWRVCGYELSKRALQTTSLSWLATKTTGRKSIRE